MLASLTAWSQPLVNLGLVGVGRTPADSLGTFAPNVDTLGGIFSGMWAVILPNHRPWNVVSFKTTLRLSRQFRRLASGVGGSARSSWAWIVRVDFSIGSR